MKNILFQIPEDFFLILFFSYFIKKHSLVYFRSPTAGCRSLGVRFGLEHVEPGEKLPIGDPVPELLTLRVRRQGQGTAAAAVFAATTALFFVEHFAEHTLTLVQVSHLKTNKKSKKAIAKKQKRPWPKKVKKATSKIGMQKSLCPKGLWLAMTT